MKIVLPGGTGHIGKFLSRALAARGHEVVVLTRGDNRALGAGVRGVRWDGSTLGTWVSEVDRADVIINLAGRSVSCATLQPTCGR
jgi:hypothetical protein